jgi:hypothetical protein
MAVSPIVQRRIFGVWEEAGNMKKTTKIKEAEAAVHTRMWSPFTCCGWLLQESVFRLVEFTEIHFRNGRGS